MEENNTSLKTFQKISNEKYRPQFHFSPQFNWMNDPNGLVYYDGEYHLFYQYHPYGTTWGPMHWGHAVSKNLVHWNHLPIALSPDEHGAIFSGSAVVDWNDTSGFFHGQSGLVAIFTHNDTYPNSDRARQRQSIAYSSDNGRTWIKYEGNPVLANEKITDFRDPKVFWHNETNKWIMVLAASQCIHIYSSPDLINWRFESTFGDNDGAHYGVWECPDLFELVVDNDSNLKKWVLLVSIGDNKDFEEGSRTQYFIGDFDGNKFTNLNTSNTELWLDYGRDNYAGVSWSDIPFEDGRKIYIGWMSNWRYANEVPTKDWRSTMTLPRELVLSKSNQTFRLYQKPIKELKKIRDKGLNWKDTIIKPNQNLLSNVYGKTIEIIANFELGSALEFGFKVCKSKNEETIIGYDVEERQLFVDRTKSGDVQFNNSFAGRHSCKLKVRDNKVKMHLFIDWSSIEAFGNDGERVITELIFPDNQSDGLELYSKDGNVKLTSLEIFQLKSIHE